MRAKGEIIALLLSISVCAVTCNDRDVDTSDKRPTAPTFSKYYEPYELNIEPNAPGYKLPLDIGDIVNFHDISRVIDINSVSNLIRHNGFAIVEPGVYSDLCSHDFDTFYRTLGRYRTPAFVTADTGLYLYHALLDETLRGIEDRAFQKVDDYIGDPKRQPFTVGKHETGCVRGLDLMALLGSSEAVKILNDEGDTDYRRHELQPGMLKDKVDALSHVDWHANLYWSWLYSLRPLLQEFGEGYPDFMQTQAWQRRQLCAALASWTQLHDDTIRQPDPTEPRGLTAIAVTEPPPPPPPPPLGHVEPLPVFWGRLLSLTRMTSKGLDDLGVLTLEARGRFSRLEKLLQRIINIAGRQLTNEPASSEDHEFFENFPDILDDMLPGMQEHGLATILAAEAMGTEQAVGDIDLIIVACPTYDGKARLAVGPVLSYYEFKHPMSDRLTNDTWRLMLDSPAKPERPGWYGPLIRPRDDFLGLTRLTNNLSMDGSPCWSPDGKRIVFVGTSKRWAYDIYVMNADGSEQKNLTNSPAFYGGPCWSPDGQKIAFYRGVPAGPNQGNSDIYVMNADGSEQKNLTNSPAFYGDPCWSPDGQKIAFSSDRDGSFEVYVMNADGTETKRLTNNRADDGSPCWSPDGKKIVFRSERAGGLGEIYVMNADGSEQKRLTNSSAYDGQPCWSPDGKQIAFVSGRDDAYNCEIYVMNADGSEQRRLTINDAKDRSPHWSPDGRQIAFESYITGGLSEICIMNLDRADQ